VSSSTLHLVVAAVLDEPRRHVFFERRLVRFHDVTTSSGVEDEALSSAVKRSRKGA
jgi:hypothetical protein